MRILALVFALLVFYLCPLPAQVTGTAWVTFPSLSDTLVIGNPVRSITSDFTGRVWWGTAHGIYRQSSDVAAGRYLYPDSSYKQKSRNNVLSLAILPDSTVYTASPVGMSRHLAFSMTTSSLITYPVIPDSSVTIVKADSADAEQTWGAGNGKIWVYADTVEVVFSADSGLAGPVVYDIAIDSTGSIWIATSGGVSRLVGNYWITYTISNSGLNGTINYAIAVAGSDSSIWIGGDDGLVQFDGDTTWTDWTDSLPNHRVKDLVYSPKDTTMWCATDSGLAGYRPNRPYPTSSWRKYFPGSTGDSLPNYRIFCVYPDTAGRVWIGHTTGVTRLKEN